MDRSSKQSNYAMSALLVGPDPLARGICLGLACVAPAIVLILDQMAAFSIALLRYRKVAFRITCV